MKILWFTNIPMPAMLGTHNRDHAASGGWMIALLEQLAKVKHVEITVACAAPGLSKKEVITENNIRFHPIPQGNHWLAKYGLQDPDKNPRALSACADLVEKVAPDVIHIHGTERLYGLLGAKRLVSPPIVLSIQGLVHEYAKHRNYFGATHLKGMISSCRPTQLAKNIGHGFKYAQFCRKANRELEILKGNRYFMGRTLWDHAHLRVVNPQAQYFHVPELLRPSFFKQQWDMESCQRHRIIFTNANAFRRDTETLLDAIAILKREFPDISMALAGGVEQRSSGKQVLQKISRLGLNNEVEILGHLNEEQMSRELLRSHVFAITSLIENSPNSLCEAQLVGLPCVASYVGGVSSLVDEGETGLLYPVEDSAVLAERIREIFHDDVLARSLGSQARSAAQRRHDPDVVTRKVLEVYKIILDKE